jgi:hypothetical protein
LVFFLFLFLYLLIRERAYTQIRICYMSCSTFFPTNATLKWFWVWDPCCRYFLLRFIYLIISLLWEKKFDFLPLDQWSMAFGSGLNECSTPWNEWNQLFLFFLLFILLQQVIYLKMEYEWNAIHVGRTRCCDFCVVV